MPNNPESVESRAERFFSEVPEDGSELDDQLFKLIDAGASPRSLYKLSAAFAQSERIAAVREFIEKVLATPKLFNGPGPVMVDTFREMFDQEL